MLATCLLPLLSIQPTLHPFAATTATTTHPPLSCIVANKEPFAHKAWRKEPYEPRPYKELRDYAITSNVPAEVRLCMRLAGLVECLLAGWLVGWLAGLQLGLIVCLLPCLLACLLCWLALLAGWLARMLVTCLASWLAGLHGCFSNQCKLLYAKLSWVQLNNSLHCMCHCTLALPVVQPNSQMMIHARLGTRPAT
jgi:hypothetical protein